MSELPHVPHTDYDLGEFLIQIGPCGGQKLKDANKAEVLDFIRILRAVQNPFQPEAAALIAVSEAYYAKESVSNTTDEEDVPF